MQQVALVTGGGRGIGQGISLALVEAGYHVTVLQRSSLAEDLQGHEYIDFIAVDLGVGAELEGVVNTIAPGWIRSQLSDDYINGQANVAEAWQGLLYMHPVGRVGEPQDIGQAVVFLASDQASFISGQVLVVDGARTSKLPLSF